MVENKILHISKKIRERREELNYTQAHLAKKLKISQNAYSKIERGHIKLTVTHLYILAQTLDTTVIEFLP